MTIWQPYCREVFLANLVYLARTNSLKNFSLRQTISRAGIKKTKKHSFTSAQVFGLTNSTGPFELPSKVVTIWLFSLVDR